MVEGLFARNQIINYRHVVKIDFIQLQPIQSADAGYTIAGRGWRKESRLQIRQKGKLANLVSRGQ